MFRALVESVCYGTGLILESFRGNGLTPESITIAGGLRAGEGGAGRGGGGSDLARRERASPGFTRLLCHEGLLFFTPKLS